MIFIVIRIYTVTLRLDTITQRSLLTMKFSDRAVGPKPITHFLVFFVKHYWKGFTQQFGHFLKLSNGSNLSMLGSWQTCPQIQYFVQDCIDYVFLGRGTPWFLSNKRPERLRENLNELEVNFTSKYYLSTCYFLYKYYKIKLNKHFNWMLLRSCWKVSI